LKDTKNGTLTSESGQFEINAKTGDILVVTAVGYNEKTVVYNHQQTLNILLKPATKDLEDVKVVTALGIVRDKRELGYNTQTITSEQLTDAPSGNWTDALAGKVAGLDLVRSNSGPGGSNKIILRGENNLTGDNEALIVLDGVVLNTAKRSGTNSGETVYGTGSDNMPADYGSNLGDLNPADFESVNILDGPAAAALYGQRGANGAIIITTKSGKNKRMSIQFRSNVNIQQINRWPDLQYEYGQGLDGADYYSYGTSPDGRSSTSGTSSAYGPKFEGQYFYQYSPLLQGRDSAATLWRPYTNQIRDFFQDGNTLTNSISVNGGNGKTTSRFSYSNTHNKWIIPNTGYNQNNVSLAFNTDFNDKLRITTQVSYNNKTSDNLPGAGYGNQSLMYWFIFWQPNADLNWLKNYWVNGQEGKQIKYPYSSYPENPYAIAYEYINRMQRNAVTGNVKAVYNFSKALSLQARTSLDLAYEQRAQERPWDAGTKMPKGSYREQNIFTMEKSADISASYKKDLNERYGFNLMLGGSILRDNYTRDQTRADSLKYPGLYSFSNAAGVLYSLPYRSQFAINSLYGLLSTHYKDLLYLDLTAREDWNSTLATPVRTTNAGFFYPSASMSFILSDAVKLPAFINYAKLRLSAAGVGSGGTTPYLTAYNYTSAGTAFEGGLQNPGTLPNADLKPLKTLTYETGFNLSMFKERLTIDLTLYTGNTKNQILSRIIDRSSGYTTAVINAGQINNKGIEFTLNATPVQTTNFKWSTSIIYSSNKNTIVNLPDSNVVLYKGPQGGTEIIAKPGGSMGDLYGIGFERSPDGQVVYDPTTGFAKLTSDVIYLGNTTPKGRVSWGNKVNYKRWSLNLLFDAQYGAKAYSLTAYKLAEQGKTTNTLPGRYNGIIGNGVIQNEDGSYRKNDVIATDIDEYYRSMYGANNGEGATFSTDFIKFREATLSYTLSPRFAKRLGLQKLSIGIYGRDLFVWSPWPDFDPEFGTLSGTDIIKGFEIGQFPSARSFGANLNISF
jgi:TonB-linked SusC/RagA family outer membrane protein